MIVVDHARWGRDDDSWTKAIPLLKEVLGYTYEEINNFIVVQDKHFFPPFAINITKEQAELIAQPFWDYDLNVYFMIYDDVTYKPLDFCHIDINRHIPKTHYYDKPVISSEQKVDPFNPPTFDSKWVNIDLGLEKVFSPQHQTPTITCPYCKSTDCKKISGLSKAGSVALWGIFALGKTTKQWHCNNCKSDF